MNKNIIERLKKEASSPTKSLFEGFSDYYRLDENKFVELIVKECVEVVKEGINNADDWDSSYWDQACENRAIAIQKHFGVI